MVPRSGYFINALAVFCVVNMLMQACVSDKKRDSKKHKTHKKNEGDKNESDYDVSGMYISGEEGKGKNKSDIEKALVPEEGREWNPVLALPRSKILVLAYLKMHNVVPDIIKKAPKDAIEVVYANSIVVDFGNELTENQVNVMPHRTVWPTEKGARYTLIFFDPDYRENKLLNKSEFLYWLVANIPDTCIVPHGQTYTSYLPPTAVEEISTQHRLIYFIYKQPKTPIAYSLPIIEVDNIEERYNFNVSKLASDYNLGNPVAANLFQMASIHPKMVTKAPKKKH